MTLNRRSEIAMSILLLKVRLWVAICILSFPNWVWGQQKETAEYQVFEGVLYKQIEDEPLKLDAYIPIKGDNNPAVLVLFGGGWRNGNRKQLKNYAIELANRGFACFAIDYRLAPKHKFPAQIEDCRSAVKWIRKHATKYRLDPNRLGVIGYSAGGHLATLLGTTGEAASENNGGIDTRIQAVVAGGAPTDFRWQPDRGNWARYWMGGNLDEVPEKFKAASSAAFADKDDPPTFFFHGEKDNLVPVIWAESCRQALLQAGVEATMHRIPETGHFLAAYNKEALKKAFGFLETHLMGETQTPDAANSETPGSHQKE